MPDRRGKEIRFIAGSYLGKIGWIDLEGTETDKFIPVIVHKVKRGDGKVVEMEMVQNAWINSKAKRTSKPIPDARVAFEMDPTEYDKYNGEYELVPGFVLTVRREGEKLMVQATGQGAAQVFPESKTKFFYKVVDAQIEFAVDDTGTATGLTLYQAGRVMPAKKIK